MDAAQPSLAPAERIVFAPVGNEDNGFTSAVVRTTPVAAEVGSRVLGLLGRKASRGTQHSSGVMSYLRVGEVQFYFIYISSAIVFCSGVVPVVRIFMCMMFCFLFSLFVATSSLCRAPWSSTFALPSP